MTKVVYQVVQHDGGWAYRQGDVYSETFATHSDALQAAKGIWHVEHSDGGDRPEAEVEDSVEARPTH